VPKATSRLHPWNQKDKTREDGKRRCQVLSASAFFNWN